MDPTRPSHRFYPGENGSGPRKKKQPFKGVSVPERVAQSKDFNGYEKLFLGEIDSLSRRSPCRATNAHIAARIGVSESYADAMSGRVRVIVPPSDVIPISFFIRPVRANFATLTLRSEKL
jgi:hypothetical protein